MHDAIIFERLGLPATVIITEPFQGLAASYAVKLGAAGYAPVVVPHPISTKEPAFLAGLAERVVSDVIARLLPR